MNRRSNQQWNLYRHTVLRGPQTSQRHYHRTDTILNTLPDRSIPISVIHFSPNRVKIHGVAAIDPPPRQPRGSTLLRYVREKYENMYWVFQHLQGLEHLEHIVYSLRQGNCAMVSDDSFQPSRQQASCAWVIGNEAQH